jgi:hypothetical protein
MAMFRKHETFNSKLILWADNLKAKKLAGWKPVYGEREGFKKSCRKPLIGFSILNTSNSINLENIIFENNPRLL